MGLYGLNSVLCETMTRTPTTNYIVLFIHQPVVMKKRQQTFLGNACSLGHLLFKRVAM